MFNSRDVASGGILNGLTVTACVVYNCKLHVYIVTHNNAVCIAYIIYGLL